MCVCVCVFENSSQAEEFKKYLSKKHMNMNFTLETEKESKLPFLDINVIVVMSHKYSKRHFIVNPHLVECTLISKALFVQSANTLQFLLCYINFL